MGYCDWMRWYGVEPDAEQTFLPSRSCGPWMLSSFFRTSSDCPAMKYGPAKPTSFLRLSLIV